MIEFLVLAFISAGVWLTVKSMKRRSASSKPVEFRDPISRGYFRVVALDDIGGANLTQAVKDFPTFSEAQAFALQLRKESEFKSGRTGSPTRYLIFDDSEKYVGDWKGPASQP